MLVKKLTDDHWKPAVVLKRCHEPRSFKIITEDGQTYRRKRKHIRPTKTEPSISEETIIMSYDDSNELLGEGVR